MIDRLRQLTCGLRGHDVVLSFAKDRLFLTCTTCGHQSSGWNLAADPATPEPVPFTSERRAAILSRLAGV